MSYHIMSGQTGCDSVYVIFVLCTKMIDFTKHQIFPKVLFQGLPKTRQVLNPSSRPLLGNLIHLGSSQKLDNAFVQS